MADLQALMAQLTSIQNRGAELVDPAAAMLAAQNALLAQLVAEVTALQPAAPATAAAATGITQEQVQEMVAEAVSSAVSAAFGKLESAVAEAQPAVAQNTGSGAAPADPVVAGPATGSASLTPDAAGTAPQAAQG